MNYGGQDGSFNVGGGFDGRGSRSMSGGSSPATGDDVGCLGVLLGFVFLIVVLGVAVLLLAPLIFGLGN